MSADTPLRDLAVVDPSALEKLREWGSADLVRKMMGLFFEHAPERIRQIRSGVENGGLEETERGAHSLKSSAGNLGARRLQAAAQRMEELASEGKAEEAGALLPQLETAYEEARETLGELYESLPEHPS